MSVIQTHSIDLSSHRPTDTATDFRRRAFAVCSPEQFATVSLRTIIISHPAFRRALRLAFINVHSFLILLYRFIDYV